MGGLCPVLDHLDGPGMICRFEGVVGRFGLVEDD